MKIFSIFLIICLIGSSSLYGQRRVAAMDAYLDVIGITKGGKNVEVFSKQLQILYEPGKATGQLNVSTLYSEDEEMSQLISSYPGSRLNFNITLTEGQFAFGDSMNEEFTAEAFFELADSTTAFLIDFEVSNLRNDDNNIFQIIGRGKISLERHLGLIDLNDLQDEISFLFTQNVTIIKP